MDIREALTDVKASWPKSSVCVAFNAWYYIHQQDGSKNEVEYVISVLPGDGGRDCSLFKGKSLESAVASACMCGDEQCLVDADKALASVS